MCTTGVLLAASDGLERYILHLQQQQLLSALTVAWVCTTGVLLAASDGLERSIFRRSVVLVYEHGNRSGARGVILSQPLGPTDPRFNPAATPGGLPALSHFLGGPVGMPGEPPHVAARSPLPCMAWKAHGLWLSPHCIAGICACGHCQNPQHTVCRLRCTAAKWGHVRRHKSSRSKESERSMALAELPGVWMYEPWLTSAAAPRCRRGPAAGGGGHPHAGRGARLAPAAAAQRHAGQRRGALRGRLPRRCGGRSLGCLSPAGEAVACTNTEAVTCTCAGVSSS